MRRHRPSKLKGLAWVVVACGIGAGFALGLSPLAHAVPWSWERKLGAALIQPDIAEACREDARGQAALKQMVKRLYPIAAGDDAFSVDVHVIKNPAVNAYALLGGRIVVNSGLIEQALSGEEVAGVLAHEIEHVRHRHIMQGFISYLFTSEGLGMIFGGASAAGLASYFVGMDFSRGQESQADEDGLRRLQTAHVDNHGFKAFFERMEQSRGSSSFLSDHPSDRSRIEMVERFENRDVAPVLSAEEWKSLKGYCRER